MVVNFTTPMGNDGAIPGEINEFIAALRLEKPLIRNFPTVNFSGVQTKQAQANQSASATNSVVCLRSS